MKRGTREVLGAILAIALLTVVGFITIEDPTITGYVVYSGGCNSTVSSSGYWELNSTVSCSSGDAFTINASDVIFDCQDYSVSGDYEANSSAFIFTGSLNNISVQNCNLTAFTHPVIVGSSSNLSIADTYIESNVSCVTGDWYSLGNNTGCIADSTPDTTPPTITIANQTVYTNESLEYQINATDSSNIINYTINGSLTGSFENGTTNFTMNSSGFLTNTTEMNVSNFTIIVNVTDSENNSASDLLLITVIQGTASVPEEEEEEEESSSSSSSSSSSGGSGGAGTTQTICGESAAWECAEWGECGDDGFERRTCQKIDADCDDPLPLTKRECTEEETVEAEEETIEEASEESEEQPAPEGVVITGNAISAFDRLKGITNSIQVLKSQGLIVGVVAALAIGFVLMLVLGRAHRKKKRGIAGANVISQLLGQKDGDEQSQKLWDWEEKNQSKKK